MRHLTWPLSGYENISRIRETAGAVKDLRTKYALRNFRYWFGLHALKSLHGRLGRPIRVLEVGVDKGQMLAFVGGPPRDAGGYDLPPWISRWTGMDTGFDEAILKRYGYSDHIIQNIEMPFAETEEYDAVVLLHILEHLLEPEAALVRLLPSMAADGAMIGGSPTLPDFAVQLHERWLRKKAAPLMHDVRLHKHLSAISSARMRRFAHNNNLVPEIVTGAFFARISNSPLENSALWMRLNMLWGALLPPLGGEVYFMMSRKGGQVVR